MSEALATVFEFDGDVNASREPDPLPEGEYPATVQDVEVKQSAAGNRVAHVTMLVSASAYPPDFADGDPDGTTVRDYRVVPKEKREWYRVKNFMAAYGVRIKRNGDGTSTVDVGDLRGQDVLVTIKHELYPGRTTPRVASVRPA